MSKSSGYRGHIQIIMREEVLYTLQKHESSVSSDDTSDG